MDTETRPEINPLRSLALPGCCETIQLPMLPNFLSRARGEGSFPLAELGAEDVTRLSIAWGRALREHWRRRFITHHGLSSSEAGAVDLPPPYTRATVDAVAKVAGVDAVTVNAVLDAYHQGLSR